MATGLSVQLRDKYLTAADAAMLVGGRCNSNKIYWYAKRGEPVKIKMVKYRSYYVFDRDDIIKLRDYFKNPDSPWFKNGSSNSSGDDPMKLTLLQAAKFLGMSEKDTLKLLEAEHFVPDARNLYLVEDIELLRALKDLPAQQAIEVSRQNQEETIKVKEIINRLGIKISVLINAFKKNQIDFVKKIPGVSVSVEDEMFVNEFERFKGTLYYNRYLKANRRPAKELINCKIYDPTKHVVPSDFDATQVVRYAPKPDNSKQNRKPSDAKEKASPRKGNTPRKASQKPNESVEEPDNEIKKNLIKKVLFSKSYSFAGKNKIEIDPHDIQTLAKAIEDFRIEMENVPYDFKLVLKREFHGGIKLEFYQLVEKSSDPDYKILQELKKKFGE